MSKPSVAIAERARARATRSPLPASLLLLPVSRRPTRLSDTCVAAIMRANIAPAARTRGRAHAAGARASIIVATVDNFLFAKLCITSILANTPGGEYEVIVVDNGSTDDTSEYLLQVSARHPQVRVIRNDRNRGFAPANNQGLAAATGDLLILLNDDTVVPDGWLEGIRSHLLEDSIGLIGPVTNRAGNESEIPASYRTYGELLQFARARRAAHRGETRDVPMLTMFCMAMRRDAYERIGPLDERFEIGMFEDDDYAIRAHRAGYRVACAEDVFVHHFGATSIGRLASDGQFGSLFDANRRRFEEKWSVTWSTHGRRANPDYQELIDAIRHVVGHSVPPGSIIAVISRGDEALLNLPGCSAWHFPQTEDGGYSGYHPADSAEAIAYVDRVRRRGATCLLIPKTMRWWLEHYTDLRAHLNERHHLMLDDESCVLFSLGQTNTAPSHSRVKRQARRTSEPRQ